MNTVLPDTTTLLATYGFSREEHEEITERLKGIAKIARAPINEIIEIYGLANLKGIVDWSDLLQLSSHGIPVIQDLQKQLSMPYQDVRRLAEAGGIAFAALRTFITLYYAELTTSRPW